MDFRPIREIYGYPHMVGHRASLAGALFAGCQKEPAIKFHFSSTVSVVESFSAKPTFRITAGNKAPYSVTADILIGADGIKSRIRTEILADLKIDAQVLDTNQAAYRIMLDRSKMENDPELLELIDTDRATRWIGEKRHIIAYPIDSNRIYNISTAQPDTNFAGAPSATYTTQSDKNDMMKVFSDFCPKVQRMLALVPAGEVCEWKLRVHSPLPTWVHGSVALIGDACHPTLPHLAQGAALAIEDAAVLAEVMAQIPEGSTKTINRGLRVYQALRKDRAEMLVVLAAASGRDLHLGQGEARKERDRQFAALKETGGSVPDKWADADVQQMIYSHDCMEVAKARFQELFERTKET